MLPETHARAHSRAHELRRGTVRLHDTLEDVLAYERVSGEDRRLGTTLALPLISLPAIAAGAP